MAKKKPVEDLARRERQIMDVVHQLGEATVSEVLTHLTDPPSYSSERVKVHGTSTPFGVQKPAA